MALLCCRLIERELRAAMTREQVPELPLYPEDRSCTAPTATRIFKHLTRDGQALQTFEPQRSAAGPAPRQPRVSP